MAKRRILDWFRNTEPEVFPVAFGDGRTALESIWLGCYDWVGDQANAFVKSGEVSLSTVQGEVDLELIELDFDLTAPEILEEFARRELERPTAEDALRFGTRHVEKQRERPIAFLHEPWTDSSGNRGVLVLRGDKRSRGLALYWYDDRWYRGVLFAARRRK